MHQHSDDGLRSDQAEKGSHTRVDQPHAIDRSGHASLDAPIASTAVTGDGEPWTASAAVDGLVAATDSGEGSLSEPLHEHAAQLAERLRQQASDVDRREAALHAREAELANEVRKARLWLEEQRAELMATEQQLSVRETSLRQGVEALDDERSSLRLDERQAEVENHERDLRQAEEDLLECRDDLNRRLEEFDIEQAAHRGDYETVARREADVEARHKELDDRQAQLYRDIEELTTERTRFLEREEAQREQQQALADQKEEIDRRAETLEGKAQEIGEEASQLEMLRLELRRAQADQEQRELDLADQQSQIVYRQQEIETALVRFERLGVTETRLVEMQQERIELQARARFLDDAELHLAQQKTQLNEDRQCLRSAEEELQRRSAATAEKLRSDERTLEQNAKQRDRRLDEREAELDRRDEAISLLEAELRDTQRDVLEHRVALEETWSQLAGIITPAKLSRSIRQLRSALDDHHRLTLDKITNHETQLESVRQELAERMELFAQEQLDYRNWSRRREQEFDDQALRLEKRETELEKQAAFYDDGEQRWQRERTDYEDRIRELLAELRQPLREVA